MTSKRDVINKYKIFPRSIYSYISTRVESGKTRNCVETRRPEGGVFSLRKYVLPPVYIFYNIAQRNKKKEIFRVDIELCQHGS